jgi:hypothetical protein
MVYISGGRPEAAHCNKGARKRGDAPEEGGEAPFLGGRKRGFALFQPPFSCTQRKLIFLRALRALSLIQNIL